MTLVLFALVAWLHAPAPPHRLPAHAAPIAYDLALELDPARAVFAGRVAIEVRLAAAADRVVVHAADLEVTSARWTASGRGGALRVGVAPGDQLVLELGERVPAGDLRIELAYTGVVAEGEVTEGVFRQRHGGAWFLYTQAESMFARRILPCFDEPRWKPRWRVAIAAPAAMVALANAPVAETRLRADGWRETRFMEQAATASHLVAVAVGPFRIVDGGRVGGAGVPLRLALLPSSPAADAALAAPIAALARTQVAALERYLDLPLPLVKLDLVAVPQLFGAMEHPGLITFDARVLARVARSPGARRFLTHELAHQWFGNLVTPAWWDDLWLAEAFATWLDDGEPLGLAPADPSARPWREAIAADLAARPAPLRRPVAGVAEAEAAFDAISYEKGAAVLAMIDHAAGPGALRDALRRYLRAHAGGSATAGSFIAALAAAASPALARAFADYLDRPGVPVVDLALRCGPRPVLEIAPRASAIVPVCVRIAGEPAARCAIADRPTMLPLARCPAWVHGNAGGRGYYLVGHAPPAPPLATLAPAERVLAGHDAAAAVARGELAAAPALARLHALATGSDDASGLGAVALARAIDAAVAAPDRASWEAWLAVALAARLTPATLEARGEVAATLRDELLALVPGARWSAAARARAAAAIVAALAGDLRADLAHALPLVHPRDAVRVATRVLAAADRATPRRRAYLIHALGGLGAGAAPLLASRLAAADRDAATDALVEQLARPATRAAAWLAIRARLPQLRAAQLSEARDALIAALGAHCDPATRAEIEVAVRVAALPAPPPPALAPALAAIARCEIAARGLGPLAPALTAR